MLYRPTASVGPRPASGLGASFLMPALALSPHGSLEIAARKAAAAAARNDPLDYSLAQVGKYRPREKTADNRVVTDVTSAQQMVFHNAAKLAQAGRITMKDSEYQEPWFPLSSQDVSSPRMTRMGQKWRGGTPAPQQNEKAFSKVWWISQEAMKCVKQDRELKQAMAQRKAEVEKVLAEAMHYDSTGASAAAIQAAHATAMRLASKSSRPEKNSASARGSRGRSKSHLGHAGGSSPAVLGVAGGSAHEAPEYGHEDTNVALPPRPHTRQGIARWAGSELGVGRPELELEPVGGGRVVEDEGARPRTSGASIRPRAGGGRAAAHEAGDRGAGEVHGQVVKGRFGNLNKYVPHFRLAARAKTAVPVRDGWGMGVTVFPEKQPHGEDKGAGEKSTNNNQNADSSIYQQWEDVDWAEEKKHHFRRSDVRSQHMNRLRYGAKVTRPDAPEGTSSRNFTQEPKMRSASWIRKGLSRDTNNVEFWSKPHNVPGWAGQNATAPPYNATGGMWVPAKRDVSQDREGGKSDSLGGEGGGGGYKRLGASLTEVLGLQEIPCDTARICTDKNEVWVRRYRKSQKRPEGGQDSVSSLMVQGVRDISTPLQLKYENRRFHEEFPGEYDNQSKRYVVPEKWRSGAGEEVTRSNYKLGQTQAPKAPFMPGDWPLHHKNNTYTTEDIRDLRHTLLPDRRAPPKIILPKDLRILEEAKLESQLSAISSDY